ncbi:hypothetical protein J6590_031144 [Homalodisca vitripennis]|nr:hypothetical protein J6590_031144 [Homalodisca vitripennis]
MWGYPVIRPAEIFTLFIHAVWKYVHGSLVAESIGNGRLNAPASPHGILVLLCLIHGPDGGPRTSLLNISIQPPYQ